MPLTQRRIAMQGTALADLLDRLAGEFTSLAAFAHSVQDLPGRLGIDVRDETAITAAQRLDVLTQRLDALASFVGALGSLVPPEWDIDADSAMSLLTLSDVRRRISGMDETDSTESGRADADDFELF